MNRLTDDVAVWAAILGAAILLVSFVSLALAFFQVIQ